MFYICIDRCKQQSNKQKKHEHTIFTQTKLNKCRQKTLSTK